MLQTQAKIIAECLGKDEFRATNGWLKNFKRRREISYKQICGESNDVDEETIETETQSSLILFRTMNHATSLIVKKPAYSSEHHLARK